MAEETNGQNGKSRLDRIEGIIEALANRQYLIEDEFARLLRAQVVSADEYEKLKIKTEQKFQQVADAQRRTDEALQALAEAQTALMGTVDEIIRHIDKK